MEVGLIDDNKLDIMTEPAYSLLYDHSRLSDVTFEVDIEHILTETLISLDNPLNDSQKNVFRSSFTDRVTLLWGPPGTGKTTTLASIILGWIEYAISQEININIGVGSSTWTAIDNLLFDIDKILQNRIEKKGEFNATIELNRIRSNSGELLDSNRINDVIVYTDSADSLKQKLETGATISINGSTWKQFYNLSKQNRRSDAIGQNWFDLLLIDEASQVKVEHAASYFLFLKENGSLILAGDDKQLGPIHGFKMQDSANGLYDCIYTFMKDTHNVEPKTIVDNYRSNWIINDWPNKRFYEEKLYSQNPENKLIIDLPRSKPSNWPNILPWNDEYIQILDPEKPVVVITYPQSIHTVSNPFESQISSALCCLYKIALGEDISENEFINKKIGIVTPHRAQRSLIQNQLLQSNINIQDGGFIDTVDRFQGQERDLIISSYSVSDRDFVNSEESFILDPRRFNVSLTRAKSKFIMIISDALIDHLSNDKDVAEDAAHLQMFVVKFCKNQEEISLSYNDSSTVKSINCKLKTH